MNKRRKRKRPQSKRKNRTSGSYIPNTTNRKLIDKIIRIQKRNEFAKGFVYFKYVEEAPYYCIEDLYHIVRKLGYNEGWIKYKLKELTESSKWTILPK